LFAYSDPDSCRQILMIVLCLGSASPVSPILRAKFLEVAQWQFVIHYKKTEVVCVDLDFVPIRSRTQDPEIEKSFRGGYVHLCTHDLVVFTCLNLVYEMLPVGGYESAFLIIRAPPLFGFFPRSALYRNECPRPRLKVKSFGNTNVFCNDLEPCIRRQLMKLPMKGCVYNDGQSPGHEVGAYLFDFSVMKTLSKREFLRFVNSIRHVEVLPQGLKPGTFVAVTAEAVALMDVPL